MKCGDKMIDNLKKKFFTHLEPKFGRGERREPVILTGLVTGSRRSPLPNFSLSRRLANAIKMRPGPDEKGIVGYGGGSHHHPIQFVDSENSRFGAGGHH